MSRHIYDVRLRVSAPAEDEITEDQLAEIIRQALWAAEDGDDVRLLESKVSIIDTDQPSH